MYIILLYFLAKNTLRLPQSLLVPYFTFMIYSGTNHKNN